MVCLRVVRSGLINDDQSMRNVKSITSTISDCLDSCFVAEESYGFRASKSNGTDVALMVLPQCRISQDTKHVFVVQTLASNNTIRSQQSFDECSQAIKHANDLLMC